MDFRFKLGRIAKDKVTGFTGVIMGRSEYFTGCNHYALVSEKLTSEGKPMDWEWFDETRLVLIGNVQIKPELRDGKGTSGPMPTPRSV